MKKELKAYYKQIRQLLPGNMCSRHKIMTNIVTGVEEYCRQNPEANMDHIQARFGRAEDLAAAYVEQQPPRKLLKALQTRKKIVSIVAGVMALMLLIYAAVIVYEVVDSEINKHGYIVTSSQEITGFCSDP